MKCHHTRLLGDTSPCPECSLAKGLEVPPRLIRNMHQLSHGGYYCAVWKPGFAHSSQLVYLSLQEAEHLLRQARAEAFEEAANYLYTKDSSDEQHALIKQLASELRLLGAVPLAKAAEARKEKHER